MDGKINTTGKRRFFPVIMNNYELFMQRGADCYVRACNTAGINLRLFWYNAAHGFEMRAEKLKSSEVTK